MGTSSGERRTQKVSQSGMLVFVICLALVGCGRRSLKPAVINRVGEHTAIDTTVRVYREGELLNYRIAQGTKGEGGPVPATLIPGSGWFVYIENPAMAWIFTGGDELHFDWSRSELEGGFYMLTPTWDTLPFNPPSDLIEMLPESMQTLIANRKRRK